MNFSVPAITRSHPAWSLVLQYRKLRDTIESQTLLREETEARLEWLQRYDSGNAAAIKRAADNAADIQTAIRQLWRQADRIFEDIERVHRDAGYKDILTTSRLLSR